MLSDENQTIGRVAAFVNQKTVMTRNEQPTGGMGFFECVYDQKAAYTLFDAGRTFDSLGIFTMNHATTEPQATLSTPKDRGATEALRANHERDMAELVAESAASKQELIAQKSGEPV